MAVSRKKAKKAAKKKPATKKAAKKKTKAKKKGAPTLTKRQRVMAIRDGINKVTKGRARMSLGSDYVLPWLTLRRPTGILSLDIACRGGLPAGAPVQIIGKPQVGKTYLSNRIIAETQKHYGDDFAAAVAMTEGRYQKDFAKFICGVRTAYSEEEIEELEAVEYLCNPNFEGFTADELDFFRDQVGMGVSEIVGGTAEDLYEAVLVAIQSKEFQIVVIDSIGALLTKLEDEGEMRDKTRGGAAAVNTQFMHKYSALLTDLDETGRANETTVIFINQYRVVLNQSKFATGPRSEMSVTGGYAIQHGKMLDIELAPGKLLTEGEGDTYRRIGKVVNWEITKQKAGGHEGHRGHYNHMHGIGADVVDDLVGVGLGIGVVEMASAWHSLMNPHGEELLKAQGREKFCEALREEPDMQAYIRDEALRRAEIRCRYGPLAKN